jgi:hypothetical protein
MTHWSGCAGGLGFGAVYLGGGCQGSWRGTVRWCWGQGGRGGGALEGCGVRLAQLVMAGGRAQTRDAWGRSEQRACAQRRLRRRRAAPGAGRGGPPAANKTQAARGTRHRPRRCACPRTVALLARLVVVVVVLGVAGVLAPQPRQVVGAAVRRGGGAGRRRARGLPVLHLPGWAREHAGGREGSGREFVKERESI